MKIAVCQSNMHWTLQENLNSILEWMKKAADQQAQLTLFTECALTGYHRRVPELLNYDNLQNAYKAIQAKANELNIHTIVGSPYLPNATDTKTVLNSALFFKPQSAKYELTSKVGLTDAEKQFFTPGEKRDIFKLNDFKIGVIFCREMLDTESVLKDYKGTELDFVYWPSYIKWDSNSETHPDYIGLSHYTSMCSNLNVPIFNVNSPNALNDDSLRGMGKSKYLKDGAIAFQGPKDEEMLKIIELN